MSRFDIYYCMALLSLAAAGCSLQIAPIEVGEACDEASDCKGFSYCYRGHCLNAPQCNLNGRKEPGEECDDGNEVSTDACTNHCLIARCGDRIVRTDLPVGHEVYEACEPALGDPDLSCGNDCILRPAQRRLQVSNHGSCNLDTPFRMRCWGAYNNWNDTALRVQQSEEGISLSSIEFWLGTELEFRTRMVGFFYSLDGGWYDLWPDEEHDQPAALRSRVGRIITAGHQIVVRSQAGLLLYGNSQGGTGEPHNPEWVSSVFNSVSKGFRDFFPTSIGSCYITKKGVLNCWNTGHDESGARPRDCADLAYLERNEIGLTTRVPNTEALVGVARSGYTVCAFSEQGNVGCVGDLAGYRPLRYSDGALCNREMPCEDVRAPICTSPTSGEGVAGVCIGCVHDTDCGPGICFDYHCYQGAHAREIAACQSSPYVLIDGLHNVVELVADESSFAARTRQGEVFRWGRVVAGQSGGRVLRSVRGVAQGPLLAPATQLAANASTMCARLDDGRVTCWGLHNGRSTVEPAIIQGLPFVADLSRATRLSNHFCARIPSNVAAQSQFYCWGQNDWYQLGDGTNEPRDHPVPVTVEFDALPRPLP